MYKVVIIDDEPMIVQGLTRSIPWDKYHCKVVGTANSGEEGLALFRRLRPNIVFSDIRMPHMDGLSMIAAMKSQSPDTEISILTGFQDFEYARQAIRLGVTRFLVKPSKMDELQEAVRTMVLNLEAKGISGEYLIRKQEKNTSKESAGEGNSQISAASAAILATSAKKPMTEEQKIAEASKNARRIAKEIEKPFRLEPVTGPFDSDTAEASSFVVNNALKYMEEHYREKLKLQEVAERVYVSQWHLSKLLNRMKGQSFSELMNIIRVEKAKILLQEPSLKIGEVAESVGFTDMAHFSRVFKNHTGFSANEYRNSLK